MNAVRTWTARKKAAVVEDIIQGRTTEVDAITDNDLSADELAGWIARYREFGKAGLHSTKCQDFRPVGDVLDGMMGRIGPGVPFDPAGRQ